VDLAPLCRRQAGRPRHPVRPPRAKAGCAYCDHTSRQHFVSRTVSRPSAATGPTIAPMARATTIARGSPAAHQLRNELRCGGPCSRSERRIQVLASPGYLVHTESIGARRQSHRAQPSPTVGRHFVPRTVPSMPSTLDATAVSARVRKLRYAAATGSSMSRNVRGSMRRRCRAVFDARRKRRGACGLRPVPNTARRTGGTRRRLCGTEPGLRQVRNYCML
jgi:hypothetical protein